MSTTWIVSADAGRARIFAEVNPHQPYTEIEDMINDAARLHDVDINTDRIGATAGGQTIHNRGGASPNHQYQPAQTPEQHDADMFARDVCAYLLKAHHDKRFQKLDLIAEPRFLGLLREKLDHQLKSLVGLELNKDYSHFNAHQLQQQLNTQKTK